MNVETALDLLRHPHRRTVVSILDETGPTPRRRLVTRLAAADAETEGGATGNETTESGSEGDARAIAIALHHNHLPRLADAGVVEYDDDTVTPTPKLDPVVECATVVEEGSASARRCLGARLSRFYA